MEANKGPDMIPQSTAFIIVLVHLILFLILVRFGVYLLKVGTAAQLC